MSVIRLQGDNEKRMGVYYEVDTSVEPIGAGGMGQVYKGVCVNMQNGATRPVAIKFMYDDLPDHAIERARREASICLRNDNLIEMLGFIETVDKDVTGKVMKHYHVVSELLTVCRCLMSLRERQRMSMETTCLLPLRCHRTSRTIRSILLLS